MDQALGRWRGAKRTREWANFRAAPRALSRVPPDRPLDCEATSRRRRLGQNCIGGNIPTARGAPFANGTDCGYRGVVVVVERVVVVPPEGSVSVFVWVSVLPSTPSR
jgi:hypothetical protein